MKDEVKNYLKEIGAKGGQKTAERGSDYYRIIGQKGKATRWGKKVK